MAGVNETFQIDAAITQYLSASRYTLQERPGIVKGSIEHEKLPEHTGPTVYIPKYGQVSTYALTEGVDMTQAQQITDTVMTITPAEYGAQVVLTDMMLMTVRDEFFSVAGRILGDSFNRQQDQTLCDDLDNFSNALGSAGVALGVGHVMAAEAGIMYGQPAAGAGRGGEPGQGRISGIFTPAQIHSLRKTLSLVPRTYDGTNYRADMNFKDSVPGSSDGQFTIPGVNVTIKSDININKDSSDDAKGGVLAERSMIFVELGPGPKSEKERDASLRGWEVNFVGRWARAEYNNGWGHEMLFDSATPTS